MTRIVITADQEVVAGLSWVNYSSATQKGIEAKEGSFSFECAAYLIGKTEPTDGSTKPEKQILAGGYALTEDLISNPDSPEQAELLKLPSLMLWVIQRAQELGYGSEGGVDGLFQLNLGAGQYWIGAVKGSVPLPFDSSDSIIHADQLSVEMAELQEQAAEIDASLETYDIAADEFFDAKPAKSVGRLKKGQASNIFNAIQLAVVAVLLLAIGWFVVQIFSDAEPDSARAPTEFELIQQARTAYQRAMQSDFGWNNSLQAYAAVVAVSKDVAYSADRWDFVALSCKGATGSCVFKYESPGYADPLALASAIGSVPEINLSGREALYRKPIDMRAPVGDGFSPPSSQDVRAELLGVAAFLRDPAFEMTVEIDPPETMNIRNGSFLTGSSTTATYQKGPLSISGPLGLMDLAANKLVIPGVVITEVIINSDEFALRGHYAFN
jgi:hypothetical protein